MKLAKDRLYYSISDVAEILDLKPSIIRFWETEFAVLKPLQKEKNAKRKFKIREIEILLKIKTLLYIEKFTIKGANDQLKNWKPSMTFQEISESLENGVIPISDFQTAAESHSDDHIQTILPAISTDIAAINKVHAVEYSGRCRLIISEIRELLKKIR